MISVIIPTLNSPKALDLCLDSAIKGQAKSNDIVVVIDGYLSLNETILNKYSNYIRPLILNKNVGTSKATNFGIYSAKYNNILIVNDDNVFPKDWDLILSNMDISNAVVAPNQIEPYNSIFKQFHIHDLGQTVENFNLDEFWNYEQVLRKNLIEETGSTYPIYIDKFNFLKCGGFDSDYPGLPGMVADWEFFMKCEMNGLSMMRTYQCYFYHFVSITAKSPEKIQESQIYEKNCHLYFKYKWGQLAQHNTENNSKLLRK